MLAPVRLEPYDPLENLPGASVREVLIDPPAGYDVAAQENGAGRAFHPGCRWAA
jgi:hypothetical protein